MFILIGVPKAEWEVKIYVDGERKKKREYDNKRALHELLYSTQTLHELLYSTQTLQGECCGSHYECHAICGKLKFFSSKLSYWAPQYSLLVYVYEI